MDHLVLVVALWEFGVPDEDEYILSIDGDSGGSTHYFQLEEYQ
ncbi:MAG: hypothetical protein ACTH6Y_12190 [Vibrio hibernica]